MRQAKYIAVYEPNLAWEPLKIPNSEGKAWIKILSMDWETSEKTLILRYEPGFKMPKSTTKEPTDVFVLEGEMKDGQRNYKKWTYHYRPPGTSYGPIETATGI